MKLKKQDVSKKKIGVARLKPLLFSLDYDKLSN